MKTNKKSLPKTISVLLIICTLSFSTDMNAATPLNFADSVSEFFHNLFNGRHKKHQKSEGANNDNNANNANNEHNEGGGNNQNNGDSIPLDGGLGILVISAAAFGVKKLRNNKNNSLL